MTASIKVVAYDGLSGSGKSTLITAIRHKQVMGLPQNIIPIDRWIPSLWAFKKMAGESPNLEYLSQCFVGGSIPFGIVWCDAPVDVCIERLHRKRDEYFEPLSVFSLLLDEYFRNECSVPYLRVDTTCSVENCVNEVWEWIQKL